MKNTWNRIKQFFTFPVVRPYWRAGDGFTETVVDLNSQEKDYINTQTRRMLLLKRARAYSRSGRQNWEKSLPASPACGSAYAIYSSR